MKEAIIFDFWGTLVENGIYSPIRQVKGILQLQDMDYSEFVERFEKVMMKQNLGDLEQASEPPAVNLRLIVQAK